jgi:hypothetical protein
MLIPRSATATTVSFQELGERLAHHRRDALAGRACRAPDLTNHHRRELHGEHDLRARHLHRPFGAGSLHIAPRLALRQPVPARQRDRRVDHRHPTGQQFGRGVDPLGDLIGSSSTTLRHDVDILLFVSLGVVDLASLLLALDIGQSDVELEVRYCVCAVLSPLLANIALSLLDDHFAEAWETMGDRSARQYRRRKGLATYRFVRYADDWVVLVSGTCAHTEVLRDEIAGVLDPMGLRLSEEKTRIVHIDEGFDFLGFRIQRHQKRGTGKRFVYTYPSKKALASIKDKVRSMTKGATDQSLSVLLHRLNPVLRGWTNYFQHGVSKATFNYLRQFTWQRVLCWLRHKHRRTTWTWLRRRYLPRWWPTEGAVTLFNPGAVTVSRYRYRANRISTPWTGDLTTTIA